jgi:hypothetical protein
MDHFRLDAGGGGKTDTQIIINHNSRERERETRRDERDQYKTTIAQLSLPAGGYQFLFIGLLL